MAINFKYLKTRVVRYPLLAIAGVAAIVVFGLNCGFTKADWGTWVGSIGTVGTLIGTILLATSERRSRRRQEFALAQVTAASFVERIRVFRHLLGYAVSILEKFEQDIPRADFESLHRINSRTEIWTAAETTPLVILPGRVAVKLSAFAMKFATTQQNLVVLHESRRIENAQIQRARCKEQIKHYQDLLKMLVEVEGFCLYAYMQSSDV
jgi:hypothetical protein